MLQGVHIIGYGPSDGKCLPCSGISGRVALAYPCSSHLNHRFKSQVRVGSPKGAYMRVSFTCRASSSGRNRNPEFPRQNRHGYSRGRNRKNEERDGFENLEESDLLSSKNGVSFSSGTKFGATAAPGPREKEIVELFRKVQAQLRERSAAKEEKKVEASQGQGKENETVDSLLKLLRKHSVEQAKRTTTSGSNKDFASNSGSNKDFTSNSGSNKDFTSNNDFTRNSASNKEFTLDHPERNPRHNKRKNTASFDSNNSLKDEVEELTASFSRPASNFQRKSPIPRLTYQAIYSEDDDVGNSVPHVNSIGKSKKNQVEQVPKPEPEPELELEAELEPEPELDTEFEFEPEPEPEQETVQLLDDETSRPEDVLIEDDENGAEHVEHTDLSTLKLPELRAIAKSRGIKGYAKMKKGELVELLSGNSV